MRTKQETKDFLSTYVENNPMYGIFIEGKLIALTNVRIYMEAKRARIELANIVHSRYHDGDNREDAYKIIDELIQEGFIEIKPIT